MMHGWVVAGREGKIVKLKGDGIHRRSAVLPPLLGHAFIFQSIMMSDVVDGLSRDKGNWRRVFAHIDTIDIQGPDATIGRVKLGMDMSTCGFHSVVENRSIALANPNNVLILAGEFNTVINITHFCLYKCFD